SAMINRQPIPMKSRVMKKRPDRHTQKFQGGAYEPVDPPPFCEWRRGALGLASNWTAHSWSPDKERSEIPRLHRHAGSRSAIPAHGAGRRRDHRDIPEACLL